jgi:hypothetical protein
VQCSYGEVWQSIQVSALDVRAKAYTCLTDLDLENTLKMNAQLVPAERSAKLEACLFGHVNGATPKCLCGGFQKFDHDAKGFICQGTTLPNGTVQSCDGVSQNLAFAEWKIPVPDLPYCGYRVLISEKNGKAFINWEKSNPVHADHCNSQPRSTSYATLETLKQNLAHSQANGSMSEKTLLSIALGNDLAHTSRTVLKRCFVKLQDVAEQPRKESSKTLISFCRLLSKANPGSVISLKLKNPETGKVKVITFHDGAQNPASTVELPSQVLPSATGPRIALPELDEFTSDDVDLDDEDVLRIAQEAGLFPPVVDADAVQSELKRLKADKEKTVASFLSQRFLERQSLFQHCSLQLGDSRLAQLQRAANLSLLQQEMQRRREAEFDAITDTEAHRINSRFDREIAACEAKLNEYCEFLPALERNISEREEEIRTLDGSSSSAAASTKSSSSAAAATKSSSDCSIARLECGWELVAVTMVCYPAIEVARAAGMGVYGIDGAHVKDGKKENKSWILTLETKNAFGKLTPIATTWCFSENCANLTFMMDCVAIAGLDLNQAGVTIMSDRSKAGFALLKTRLAKASHRFCEQHIIRNIRCALKRKDFHDETEQIRNCFRALTAADFDRHFTKLANDHPRVHKYLAKLPRECWASYTFVERNIRTFGIVNNNMCESRNNACLVARKQKSILEGLYELARDMNRVQIDMQQLTRSLLLHSAHVIIRRAWDEYEENRKSANEYTMTKVALGPQLLTNTLPLELDQYLVTHKTSRSSFDGIYTVDLHTYRCSCAKWQDLGIPCPHAAAVFVRIGLPPNAVASIGFNKIYHVSGYSRIPLMNFVVPILETLGMTDTEILPPGGIDDHAPRMGRPSMEKRFRSNGES